VCVNFNDCLTGDQLHYDWDKITVTRRGTTGLNESHFDIRDNFLVY